MDCKSRSINSLSSLHFLGSVATLFLRMKRGETVFTSSTSA